MNPAFHPRAGRPKRAAAFAVLVAAAALLAAAAHAADPPVPAPAGFVNDTAGVMGEWAERTEALCRNIEKKSTAEVAVLTVRSVSPLPVEEYARLVFDRWKVGKKGKDNGVLIVVAIDDRKMFIATGYGVEGILPDGKVGEIRDREMVPRFRKGNYGEGIFHGVSAIGRVLTGQEPGGPPGEARPGREGAPRGARIPAVALLALLVPLLILWIILRPFFFIPGRRGGGPFFGGYGGGFGGGGFGGGGFGGFGGGGFGGGGAGGSW